MRKTIEQKLHSKKIHKPNFLIYNFLGYLWKFTVARKYHLQAEFIDNPKKEKGPYILLSNDASSSDYIFIAVSLLHHSFIVVCGYYQFF